MLNHSKVERDTDSKDNDYGSKNRLYSSKYRFLPTYAP